MRFMRSVFFRVELLAALAAMFFGSFASAVGQSEWLVHSFAANGSQGNQPQGNLVADGAGNLYGTTYQGGAFDKGTVYELVRPVPPAAGWVETLLYSFTGGADGSNPFAGVVFDNAGNLYGTTLAGGTSGVGTVFELKPPVAAGGVWTESVLHSFSSAGGDGFFPYGGVVFDDAGDIYGTTHVGEPSNGGGTSGTVFELVPPAIEGGVWTESVLYYFSSPGLPESTPILDAKGNLYGTASAGGHNGGGALWRLLRPSIPGRAWGYRSLYVFGGGTTKYDPTDGYAPWDSPTLRGGNLYGTTTTGGQHGFGSVFQLVPPAVAGGAWTENTLYSFAGGTDGANPTATVIFDSSGNMFGTTSNGGTGACTSSKSGGCGTVFELAPPSSNGAVWAETVLHSFSSGGEDGVQPLGGLVFGKNGVLFGVTSLGGNGSKGAAFGVIK